MPRTAEAFRQLYKIWPFNRLFLLCCLFLFVFYGFLVFAADELDQRHFGAIAFARAEFEDSSISARAVGEAISQFPGQFLQRRDAGCDLCVLDMFFAVRPGVAREEKRRRLTSGVHCGFAL